MHAIDSTETLRTDGPYFVVDIGGTPYQGRVPRPSIAARVGSALVASDLDAIEDAYSGVFAACVPALAQSRDPYGDLWELGVTRKQIEAAVLVIGEAMGAYLNGEAESEAATFPGVPAADVDPNA